jgi:hypothetical protein
MAPPIGLGLGLSPVLGGRSNPLGPYAAGNGALPTEKVYDFRRALLFTGAVPVGLVSSHYTYANTSGGVLEMVDSDGVTKAQPHNFAVASEAFDAVYWGKLNCTITANQTTDPDGGTGADLITDDVVDNVHYVQDAISLAPAELLSIGVCAKADTLDWLLLRASFQTGWFDLANGALGTNPSFNLTDGAMTSLGGGWYLCRADTTTLNPTLRIGSTTGDGVVTYAGSGQGIYLWGAFAHLQGMVNNPDRGDEYVPNASLTAAAFMARNGHYVDSQRAGLLFDATDETMSLDEVPGWHLRHSGC